MATKLGVAPNYFTDFAGGQGVGASNYFTYAQDLDTNFAAIKVSVNALIDEVQAVGGTAAVIAFDLFQFNDPLGPFGQQLQGVIGAHSYALSFPASNEIQVERGQAVLQGARGVSNSVVNFTGITGDGDKFIALDAGGVPFLETASGQRILDVAKVTMTGGSLVASSLEQLAHIFQDGDDDDLGRHRPTQSAVYVEGSSASSGVLRTGFKAFRRLAGRFEALERMVIGLTTDGDGDALPNMGIQGGSAASPGLILTNGSGTRDTGTGLYRLAANVIGFAVSGAERMRINSTGVKLQNGSEANPSLAAQGDTDTGLRFGSGFVNLVAAGADVLRAAAGQALLNVLGVVGAPALSFEGDEDTGLYSPGANRLGLVTAGAEALEVDPQGNVDLPLQTRGIARRAAVQNIATGTTLLNVSFDTEDEDIGGSFAPTSADFTVPTGGDGRYGVALTVTFDESSSTSPNANDRGAAVEFAGTSLGFDSRRARVAGDTEITVYAEANLTAGQIFRGQAFQDSGGAMDVTARMTWRKLT